MDIKLIQQLLEADIFKPISKEGRLGREAARKKFTQELDRKIAEYNLETGKMLGVSPNIPEKDLARVLAGKLPGIFQSLFPVLTGLQLISTKRAPNYTHLYCVFKGPNIVLEGTVSCPRFFLDPGPLEELVGSATVPVETIIQEEDPRTFAFNKTVLQVGKKISKSSGAAVFRLIAPDKAEYDEELTRDTFQYPLVPILQRLNGAERPKSTMSATMVKRVAQVAFARKACMLCRSDIVSGDKYAYIPASAGYANICKDCIGQLPAVVANAKESNAEEY